MRAYAQYMTYRRRVAVVGAGKTPFGAFADQDLRSLAVAAGGKALTNAGMKAFRDRGVLPGELRGA